jgi:hypothetical protein
MSTHGMSTASELYVAAGVPAAPEIAATIEGGSPAFKILQSARLPSQKENQQFSGYAGAVSPFVRTSAIVAVKSSTPVLGTMMLLRRP